VVLGFWSGLILGMVAGAGGLIALIFGGSWLLDRLEGKPSQPTPPDHDPQLDIELTPEAVPEELREVVPIAKKFGVGCDGLRMEVINAASADEVSELRVQMQRHWYTIQKWIDYTAPNMPDWLVPIMYAQTAAEELDPPVIPPDRKA